MSRAMDRIVDRLRRLPEERQDEVAALLDGLLDLDSDPLSPAQWADAEAALRELDAGQHVGADEVKALFERHRARLR